MDKQKALDKIAKEIENCKNCKIGKSGKAVVGEGSPNAEIVFIGEAPGKNEALVGRPFIGRSGKLLRSMITSIVLKEKDVYITSPVKYLPNSGTPSSSEIAHGRIHLAKHWEIIKPKIVVLLGRVAAEGATVESLNLINEKKWYEKLSQTWQVGEDIAHMKLADFLKNGLNGYKNGRNFPFKQNVSRLSPHIHFGEISINQIWHSALIKAHLDGDEQDIARFIGTALIVWAGIKLS